MTSAAPTLTFSHTAPAAATNSLLIVGVSINLTNSNAASVLSVTYNNAALSFVGVELFNNSRRVELWRFAGPAVGANSVVVTVNNLTATATGVTVGAVSFTGVDQTTPLGAPAGFQNNDNAPTVTVASAVGDVVVDTLAAGGNRTISAIGVGQAQQWNLTSNPANNGGTDVRGFGSTEAAAGATTVMSETLSGNTNWAIIAVAVKPALSDLSIQKTGSPQVIALSAPGNTTTYTLVVTNNGPSTSTGAIVTDVLPAGLTWNSSSITPSGSCAGTTTVTCTLGSLASGATATITIGVTATTAGGKRNTATVAGGAFQTDLTAANNSASTTTIVQVPGANCALPGKDGVGGTLGGIVNTYYPGTATSAAGATSIAVGTSSGSATAITANDLLLVMQMQDAAIDSTNTLAYGDGVAGGNASGATNIATAGLFEFVKATGAVAAGSVPISGAGAGAGLLNTYTNADATTTHGQQRFQVIRVPQYTTATLGSATALAWSTNTAAPIGLGTGGVLAVDVAGALTITGTTANANGLGFRGGAGRQLGGDGGVANTDIRNLSTLAAHGQKGEGIAGTPRFVQTAGGLLLTNQPNDGYPNGSSARGAPANAGGGGTDFNPSANDQNSGGGGGANGGNGDFGGNSWFSNAPVGGFGGTAFPASGIQFVMGGGGGAGSRNDDFGDGQASGGSAGGGIIILRAAQILGTGKISAKGTDAYNLTLNDAGGGGGAGGSVLVVTSTGNLSNLTVDVTGGKGGNAWSTEPAGAFPGARHGPGGGGGGGVVILSSPAAALLLAGGTSGTTTDANDHYGTSAGAPGGTQAVIVPASDTPGAPSGADCSADPAVTITPASITVPNGGNTSFTVSVKNAAAFIATSGTITVSTFFAPTNLASNPQTLQLTPTSATGTGWVCTTTGDTTIGFTVSCVTSATRAAGLSFPDITINVSVASGGPTNNGGIPVVDTVTSTLSVSGGLPNADYNLANDTASTQVAILGPTFAKVRTVRAVRYGNSVRLIWRTGYEVSNLGFRVYREVNGERTAITPSLIAGSALLVGARRPLDGGRNYRWIDREAESQDVRYWLEDLDVNGARMLNGPYIPELAGPGEEAEGCAECNVSSTLLSELSRNRSGIGAATPAPGFGSETRFAPLTITPLAENSQFDLAAQPGIKLGVRQEGWYRVTRSSLAAAGWDPGSDSKKLQLIAEGVEQPILITEGKDGSFDAADFLEFYGTGIDTVYSDTRVYWLVQGNKPGLRVEQGVAAPNGPAAGTSFTFTNEIKQRFAYFAALTTNGEADNFFGDVISSTPQAETLAVRNLDPASAANQLLTLTLQGINVGGISTHTVRVVLNGQFLGTISYTGQTRITQAFSVPAAFLVEGNNTLTLTSLAGAEDYSFIDTLRLTYAHLYTADQNALKLTVPVGAQVTVKGFSNSSVIVEDITDPLHIVSVAATVAEGKSGFGATFTAAATTVTAQPRTYLALASDRLLTPPVLTPNKPSDWNTLKRQADLVVIAHPSLIGAATALQNARQAQGLQTVLVDVTDVYDEFSWGEKSAQALRDFLARTRSWRTAPRYVVLLGDASEDPRNYLGFGDTDLVPTKPVATTTLKTASDDWFVDLGIQSLPQVAVGRIPARTLREASTIISKILAHDTAVSGGWGKNVLLVADHNDGFNFEAEALHIKQLVPPIFSSSTILARQSGAATHDLLVSALNAGQLIVNFSGHGSETVWSKTPYFDLTDASQLSNGSKLPVFVIMNCLNGLFHDAYGDSMAEVLLRNPNGGAVAVWASSGLTDPNPQQDMNYKVMPLLLKTPAGRLGDAVIQAKAATSDLDVRRTWILFGDPSMLVR